MPKVISIHDYILKPGVEEHQFENALRTAQERGLFHLSGLVAYHFVKGIKGERQGQYTAIWIYKSREAWEALWGSVEQPRGKHEYPANWQIWEDDILAPLLTQEPDVIRFTSYEALPLRALGAIVSDVLCVIDREAGGTEHLAAEGLRLHALFTMPELQSLAQHL